MESIKIVFRRARINHIVQNYEMYIANVPRVVFWSKFATERIKGVFITWRIEINIVVSGDGLLRDIQLS
jgi:hypothetical protein